MDQFFHSVLSFSTEVPLERTSSLFQNASFYKVFTRIVQAEFMQCLFGRNPIMIPPLELIIRIKVLLLISGSLIFQWSQEAPHPLFSSLFVY